MKTVRIILLLASLLIPGSAFSQTHNVKLEIAPYLHTLNNGYGTWRGSDFRLTIQGKRFTPIFSLGFQERDEGSQLSYGAASYIVFSDAFYSIVSVSAAPSGDVELFPKSRYDLAGYWKIPGATGLVGSLGITHFELQNSDGQILSVGGILYKGKTITTALLRVNRDGASEDLSVSGLGIFQWGREGKRWIGVSLGGGREAYQIVSATPFDVRFNSVNAGAFLQQWVTSRSGMTARYEFEHKFDAYERHGFALGIFAHF